MKIYLKGSVERVIHNLEQFTIFDIILFNGVILLINKLIVVM